MSDNLTPEQRSYAMSRVGAKRTRLERRFFSMLAGMRIRGWRTHASNLVGKPDVVFDRERIAVFLDGCFWHGCPTCGKVLPVTNRSYWQAKIARNVQRREACTEELERSGWLVLRVWEHELSDIALRKQVYGLVKNALAQRRGQREG